MRPQSFRDVIDCSASGVPTQLNAGCEARCAELLGICQQWEEKQRQTLEQVRQLEQENNLLRAEQARLLLENARLVESRAFWEQLATTDPITEIPNRRALRRETKRPESCGFRAQTFHLSIRI